MTAAVFWNKLARRYAARPVADIPAYEATLDHVRRYLAPNQNVIEVGCGTGSTALVLAENAARYTGTDFSSEMIAIAREKLAKNPLSSLDFAETGATLDTEADASRDVVLGFNLYHLVPDLDASLSAAHRVLKPGGLFITKTPCIASMWYVRPIIGAMRLVGKTPSVLYLTPEAYDKAIERAGFEIIEASFYGKGKTNRFVVARKP